MRITLLVLLMLTMTGLVYGSSSTKPVTPPPPATDELVALLPQSDFFVVLNVEQILAKATAELAEGKKSTANNPIPNASDMLDLLAAEATKVGVDIHQIKRIMVAGKVSGHDEFCLVASGKFDEKAIIAALNAQNPSLVLTAETYQGTKIYVEKEKNPPAKTNNADQSQKSSHGGVVFFGTDLVMVGEQKVIRQALDVRAGKHPGLLTNAEMNNYCSLLNEKAALGFVVFLPESGKNDKKRGPAEKKPAPGQNPTQDGQQDGKPDGSEDIFNLEKTFSAVRVIYGTIDLSNGCDLEGALVTKTEEDAKLFSKSLNGLVGFGALALREEKAGESEVEKQLRLKALELINLLVISQVDKEVRIGLNIPEKLTHELTLLLNSEVQAANQKSPEK